MRFTARRGVGLAKTQTADFLARNLPAYLALLRDEWDVPAAGLPDPVIYLRNQPHVLDRWPLIAVTATTAPRLRRAQYLDSDVIEYAASYSVRVFVWVRALEWDPTIDMRDNMVTAVTSLLLSNPTLDVPDEAALVQDDSLSESYSDVTSVKGDRFVAGAFVEFTLLAREAVSGDLAGTVAAKHVVASPLPHPALD